MVNKMASNKCSKAGGVNKLSCQPPSNSENSITKSIRSTPEGSTQLFPGSNIKSRRPSMRRIVQQSTSCQTGQDGKEEAGEKTVEDTKSEGFGT